MTGRWLSRRWGHPEGRNSRPPADRTLLSAGACSACGMALRKGEAPWAPKPTGAGAPPGRAQLWGGQSLWEPIGEWQCRDIGGCSCAGPRGSLFPPPAQAPRTVAQGTQGVHLTTPPGRLALNPLQGEGLLPSQPLGGHAAAILSISGPGPIQLGVGHPPAQPLPHPETPMSSPRPGMGQLWGQPSAQQWFGDTVVREPGALCPKTQPDSGELNLESMV